MEEKLGTRIVLGALLAIASAASHAAVVFNSWASNESPNGSYVVTITDIGSQFNVNVTVTPWNAEVLGLFLDFGNVSVGSAAALGLTNVTPSGEVSIFAVDTTSDDCGMGCNLNGLSAPLVNPDNEWEAVFRLGEQGSDGIQTFSFQINDLGLGEGDIKLVGIRAQQLCDPGDTLPDGDCEGSDKVYSQSNGVPEPGSLALIALGLLGLAAFRRGRRGL